MYELAVSTYSYFERDLKRWTRGKISIITSIILPATMLIFVGLALPTKFTTDYLDFIAPGIFVMTTLFTSLQGGLSLSFDKVLGYINKFLALPSPRESILLGKIFFITVRSLIQVSIIFIIALLLGADVITGWKGIIIIYVTLFIFACMISSIAVTIAILTNDYDTYSAINNLISMPLFFGSTALMPYDSMPQWLKLIASLNPVSYTIDSVRAIFFGDWYAGLAGAGELLGMTFITMTISVLVFRKITID